MTAKGLVDIEKVRATFETLASGIAAKPGAGIARVHVATQLVEDVSAEATWRQFGKDFSLRCDEPPGRGGKGEAPTSLRYFFSGIAFCHQVWVAKSAALLGCVLGDLRIDLHAELDMRREFDLEPERPAEFVIVDTAVVSSSSSDLVLEATSAGIRRCPLRRIVEAALPVYDRVSHNGHVLRDAVPP
jgi:hypothetical protein